MLPILCLILKKNNMKKVIGLFVIFFLIACNQKKEQKEIKSDSLNVAKENVSVKSNPLQDMTPEEMKDSLAKNPSLFIKVASKHLHWEKEATPSKVVGPIYFVGTSGLSSFLITTSKGHILLYTGMSSSGPMIEKSIKELGFNPKDIKIILTGHAHIDHVGGHAYIKKISGAQVAIMDVEKELLESGGKTDFHYANYPEFLFEPVKADRVLHDGEKVTLGEVTMTAMLTPGHTKGGTTWIMDVNDKGKKYKVVCPDGTSINPGYRLVVNPSYSGIESNYAKTLAILENLRPDIWLSSHTDFFDFLEKQKKANELGVKAFVDPEGYKKRIANERINFEGTIKREKGL
jgi:metallo-beta-lactamase class B